MASDKQLPEFVLFGDSLTEWSFDSSTDGFGLFLEKQYAGKVNMVNEGQAGYTSTALQDDFTRIITRATSASAPKTLLMTIFLCANDACFVVASEYVPWDRFSQNIRTFVDTILSQDAMSDTKIVLIGPPPIGGQADEADGLTAEDIGKTNERKKGMPGYRTYMSKKRYAEGMMGLAKDYEETGRVVGLDFWRKVVEAGSEEGGGAVDEEKLIGCGLIGAKNFSRGYFTDGLHMGPKGYRVLSKELFELIKGTWPELAPEQL